MSFPEISKHANTYQQALSLNPNNKDLNGSAAFCFLKLRIYDKALEYFEKAIIDNFDNSEIYFYASVCLLKGNKPFLAQRPAIDKIIEYIQAAIMIEPRAIYYYFFAYIKYDYFFRKHFLTTPGYEEIFETAKRMGTSENDITQLYDILGVSRPNGF
jgi:tetratricopeptide (TPR) repeat protein